MKKKIITSFNYIFLLFFCFTFTNCIFVARKSIINFDIRVVLIITAIFFILSTVIYILWAKVRNLFKNKYLKIIISAVVFLLVFIAQVIIAKSYYYPVGWDVGVLTESGRALAINQGGDYVYFQRYPNNVFLLWIFKNIYNISTMFSTIEYEFALVIFNIIMIDLAVFTTMLLSKKIFKDKSSVITAIFCTIVLLFSPWMAIVYSDTLGLLFPVLLLYIYLNIRECNNNVGRCVLSILMGIVALIGYQVKPTNIIVIIAIIISMFFFEIKDRKTLLNCGSIIICIIIGFLTLKILYNHTIANQVVNGVDLSDNYDLEVPATHFLLMGIEQHYNSDGKMNSYGGWNAGDYDITCSILGKKEKTNAHIAEYKNRLKEFGVLGYLNFLNNKSNWILNDGTFFYNGEGFFVREQPTPHNKLEEGIQKYYVPTSDGYVKVAHCYQGIWVAILFLLAVPICFKVDAKEEIFIMRLTVVGIVVFLLLFEARSRYLINHVPIFILLAVYGFRSIAANITLNLQNNK